MAFLYKREVSVDNTGLGSTLTNYQIRVALTSSNFDFTHAQSDGDDLRFYADEARTTPLDHWILSYDSVGQTAVIWVEVDSIAASSVESIWLFYGDNALASGSDLQATFLGGDDWEAYNRAVQFALTENAPHDSCKIGDDIYVGGRDDDQDLVLHKSTDDGVTWTVNMTTVWSFASGNHHLTIDTNGGTNIYAATVDSTNLLFKLSTDSGGTFGSPVTVASGLSGPADPKILYVSSSLLLCFVKVDNTGSTDDIRCYSSSDSGSNWSLLSTVVSESATSGIEDLDAIVDGNGDIRVCWENETTEASTSALKEAVSTDDGATWGSAVTIQAASGTVDNEGPHYMLDGSNNLSVIYPSNAGTAGRSYDYNQIYQQAYSGGSWQTKALIYESHSHVESVGEYTSTGDLLLLSKRHHGDDTAVELITAVVVGANETDFSDRGWTQVQGVAWVRVDPADSGNNVLRLDGFTGSAEDGWFIDDHSGGDYIIEGKFRSDASSPNLRVTFGYQDVSNSFLLIFSTNVFLFERVSGTNTQLAAASPTLAASANTWYAFKIQMSGSSPTTIKIWLNSGADEATTLRINTTDSSFSSGKTGLTINGANTRIPFYCDDFRVRKFASTEPSVTVGSELSVARSGFLSLLGVGA